MNDNFHILLDFGKSEMKTELTQVISSLKLPNSIISFSASPSRGYFVPVPANLLIFSADVSRKGIAYYSEKHGELYPESKFIFIGNNFYFHEKIAVLEIPEERYLKYLSRCLMNEYLEFNKQRITRLIKESFGKSRTA